MTADLSGESRTHGARCDYSSNQGDWCDNCRHDWRSGAMFRFFRGITIVAGVPLIGGSGATS